MKILYTFIVLTICAVMLHAQDTKLIIQNAGGAEYFTFSSDGKYMATAGPGGIVKLWTIDGVLLQSFQAHEAKTQKVLFSPDSTQLFTQGEEFAIKQWTLHGQHIRTYGSDESPQRAFYDMALSPDGTLLLTADGSNGVVVWRTDGTLFRLIKTPNLEKKYSYDDAIIVHCVTFSPDGSHIVAAGGIDYYETPSDFHSKRIIGRMYMWNLEGVLERTFLPEGDIWSVAFDGKGEYLLTMVHRTPENPDDMWDTAVCGWRIDGKKTSDFPDLFRTADKVFWTSSGNTFLAMKYYSPTMVSEWDIHGVQRSDPKYFDISASQFFPAPFGFVGKMSDNNQVYTVLYDYNGEIKPVKELPTGSYDIIHVKSGGSIVLSSGWYQKVTLIDHENGNVRKINDFDWPFDVSDDGRVIAGLYNQFDESGNSVGQFIRILNKDGSIVRTFKNDVSTVQSIAMSADGSMVAVGYTVGDYTNPKIHCRIFKTTGELVRIIPVTGSEIGTIEFSPDGKQLMCVTGGRENTNGESSTVSYVSLYSINSGFIRKFAGTESLSLIDAVFDRSGSQIMTWTYNGCELWSVQGQLKRKLDVGATDGNSVYRFVNSCAFSPDGKKFITAHRGNTINIWSIEGQLDKTLYGHTADVYDVKWLNDGIFAVTCSADGSVKFWNTKTTQSVSVIPFNTSPLYVYDEIFKKHMIRDQSDSPLEWFISNEAGYFDCSNGGRQYVKFVKDFTAYEPDQFWQQFFTPGMLPEFISGKKILQQQSIGDVSGKAPVVRIISPDNEFNAKSPIMSIRVEAKPGANGIGQVFLYHNGKAITEKTRGISVRKEQNGLEFTVELVDGQNTFVAAAYDKDGTVEGRSDAIIVQYSATTIEKPSMHIIAVGVSTYKDVNIRLRSPKDDARAIAEHFQRIASGIYGNVYVSVLVDNEATVKGIMKALNDIVARAKAQDTVILYFAGHGVTIEGKYYFLPYEADITQVETSSITTDDLSGFIQGIAAKKIALLMDTCQSGSAVRDLGVVAMTRSVEERRLVATLAKDQGIAVFSASSESQAAYEIGELGHGIFTWCVINALTVHQKDIAQNGVITISGLLDYVSRETRETAFKYLKTDQSPVMYNFGDNFSLGMAGK